MKEENEKKPSAPNAKRSASAKASWTPERRKAFSERQKERPNALGNMSKRGYKRKGGEETSVVGVLTFLKFVAKEVLAEIKTEELNIKTLRRKDVLALLAFVDLRDRR